MFRAAGITHSKWADRHSSRLCVLPTRPSSVYLVAAAFTRRAPENLARPLANSVLTLSHANLTWGLLNFIFASRAAVFDKCCGCYTVFYNTQAQMHTLWTSASATRSYTVIPLYTTLILQWTNWAAFYSVCLDLFAYEALTICLLTLILFHNHLSWKSKWNQIQQTKTCQIGK